jgi:cell shape-determining protein MreC
MIREASKRLIRSRAEELRTQATTATKSAMDTRARAAALVAQAEASEADASVLNAEADELESDLWFAEQVPTAPTPAPVLLPEPEHVEPAPETAG